MATRHAGYDQKRIIALIPQEKLHTAVLLYQQGKFAEAEKICAGVVKSHSGNIDALHLLGVIAVQTGRAPRAVEMIGKAIAINANAPRLHHDLGYALANLRRNDEAIESYDRAIKLDPTFAEAFANRGNAQFLLTRFDEAVASYQTAIALNPRDIRAHNNLANAFQALNRFAEALASYDAAITLKPDYAEAHGNRGAIFKKIGRFDDALASYDTAIALKDDYVEAHANRASVLQDLRRYEEALASYDRAFALKPDLQFLAGNRLNTKMRICDWSDFKVSAAEIVEKIARGEKASRTLPVLALTDALSVQKQAAEIEAQLIRSVGAWPYEATPTGDRIRIGYFSADFRDHPVAHLMAGIFERHDRSRFVIHAFSFGPDDASAMRARAVAAFDSFTDVRHLPDAEVARLARESGIDIAVDLTGYTRYGRTGIFACRAAPIQVSYLGFSATTGSDYMDYILADETLIPERYRAFYSEKVVYLPDSYLPNDDARAIAEQSFTRAELGLPDDGFVFCCFNNSYKITPDLFDVWMRLLHQIEGSVLWLRRAEATTMANLRREAEQRGIGADRLIFADRLPMAEHLARHRAADLFLDTLPYNAHATAADALWAGLPVLTCAGEAYAGRVAASLLMALDLPELVVQDRDAYEALAVRLARDPQELGALRSKLAANLRTKPLFDTARMSGHLERAYSLMWERKGRGLPPDHLVVE